MNQQTNPQNPNANLYPNPQDQTPPVQNQQTTLQANPSQQPPPKNNSTKTILIVLGACAGLVIVVILVFALMVYLGLNGARGKAKDAKIKTDLSAEMSSANVWYDQHNTYQGFTVSSNTKSDIQSAGSNPVVQGLTQSTFVIYAQLPDAKTYYCVDATGFGGEVASVLASKTTCK